MSNGTGAEWVEQFAEFVAGIAGHHDLMTLGEDDTVIIDGVEQPSFRKDIKDRVADFMSEIEAMIAGKPVYETLAELELVTSPTIPSGQTTVAAEVLNDSTDENNGLYVWDVSASEWVKSPYFSSDLGITTHSVSSFFEGDFKLGDSGWNVSGTTTNTFDNDGLTITKDSSSNFNTVRVWKTVSGGIDLIEGHKYAFYADFDVEADRGISGVDTVLWRPFILSATDNSTSWLGSTISVGDTDSPESCQIVRTFVSTETATRGNAYTDFQGPLSNADQNVLAIDFKATYRSYFIFDLGDSTSAFYHLSDDELKGIFSDTLEPLYPETEGFISKSLKSSSATTAERADSASQADLATLATTANAVNSTYANKRIITLGHSLVSQQGWQGYLKEMLDFEGYSVQGITGGTLQPKPFESPSVDGMFSRAYMNDMVANIINNADAENGGIVTSGLTDEIKQRTAATIFWLGANDNVTDIANSPFKKLYLDGDFISTLYDKAEALSIGDYADEATGFAATSEGEYFATPAATTGYKNLYLDRGSLGSQIIYIYPEPETSYSTDRVMTDAEQDEFEARNDADGVDAFLSEPLSTGLIVTYETLYHTMIYNYLSATGFDSVPEHQFFIVIEPQAFWIYDDTMDWPQGHFEKNEVHRRVASRWGIPIIDQWNESGINLTTRGWFLQNEANGELLIHHTEKGGYMAARLVASRMNQFPVVDLSGYYGADLGLPTTEANLSPWDVDNIS